jgi:hypothetical protein
LYILIFRLSVSLRTNIVDLKTMDAPK